jgi:hypothetical protein
MLLWFDRKNYFILNTISRLHFMLLGCVIGTRKYWNMLLVKHVVRMEVRHSYKILDPIREGKILLWRTKRPLEDNINTKKNRLRRYGLDWFCSPYDVQWGEALRKLMELPSSQKGYYLRSLTTSSEERWVIQIFVAAFAHACYTRI